MPLNINFQQVFLHMFNFALLFGAMYFLLYQPVKKFMDERAARYAKMDEEAKAALDQAEQSKADYEKKLADVSAEIEAKKAEAHAALDAELEIARASAQRSADEIVEKSRKAAQREREKMLREAEGEISELVAAAAEKLVLQSTEEAYEQFLATAEERGANA